MSAARLRLEVLEDVDLRLGLHLADGVGRGLVVEGGDDSDAVAAAELVDDRGQVRRVQLRQALVGTRSFTLAIVRSTGSTSSQSM
jgi:hypothetical protein